MENLSYPTIRVGIRIILVVKNQTPIGITIHEMDEKIDNGKYFVRERFNFDFPYTAGDIFDISLKILKVYL